MQQTPTLNTGNTISPGPNLSQPHRTRRTVPQRTVPVMVPVPERCSSPSRSTSRSSMRAMACSGGNPCVASLRSRQYRYILFRRNSHNLSAVQATEQLGKIGGSAETHFSLACTLLVPVPSLAGVYVHVYVYVCLFISPDLNGYRAPQLRH